MGPHFSLQLPSINNGSMLIELHYRHLATYLNLFILPHKGSITSEGTKSDLSKRRLETKDCHGFFLSDWSMALK